MYGFTIDYPDTWEVELRPRSLASAGDLAFKTKGLRVYLTWGDLARIRKKFGTLEQQAEASLKQMKKGGDVRRVETMKHEEMAINGHRSIFNSARFVLGTGIMALKTSKREVCTLHLQCERSGKFFVVYANAAGEGSLDMVAGTFQHMISTLRCHSQPT